VFLIALFALGVLSGATAAVIGFGIGSLLTPFLLSRLSAPMAIAVVSLPHLLATAVRFTQHRRAVDSRVVVQFGLPSAAGGFLGAWTQQMLSESALFVALGVLLLATAVASLTGNFGGRQPSAPIASALGAFAGFSGGLVGNQGGLRAAGLLAFQLQPRAYLATGTAVALLIDAARTPVYLARAGSELRPLVVPIAVAAAGCLLGTVLGEKVFLGIRPDRYRQVVGLAVGALGLWLLARVP